MRPPLFQSAGHDGQRPAHDEVHEGNHPVDPQGSGRVLETVRVDDLLTHFDDLDHAEKHGQRRRFHDSCRQIHRSRQKPTQRLRQNHCDERLPATQPKHIRGLILGFRNRLKRATHQIAQFRAAPQHEHEHACAGRIQIPIPRTGETVKRDEQQRQLRHDANEIQINPGQHTDDGIFHRHQPADDQSHRNGKTHRNTGDPHRNPQALQQAREFFLQILFLA